MNNKGFSLIELLGCILLMGVVLCIGLYSTRGTLGRTFSVLTKVSENEIYDTSEMYILENDVKWNDGDIEYTCLTVKDLVDKGYFDSMEVSEYIDKEIKVIRDNVTKVISSVNIVDVCE